jgi:hypothetical protein
LLADDLFPSCLETIPGQYNCPESMSCHVDLFDDFKIVCYNPNMTSVFLALDATVNFLIGFAGPLFAVASDYDCFSSLLNLGMTIGGQ